MTTRNYKFGKSAHGAKASVETDDTGTLAKTAFRNLHVLITPASSGNGFFAQAYEIDYAVHGSSLEQVKERFVNGLTATVHHYMQIFGGVDNLLKQVNTDWWSFRKRAGADDAWRFSFECTHAIEIEPLASDDKFPFDNIEYETVMAAAA